VSSNRDRIGVAAPGDLENAVGRGNVSGYPYVIHTNAFVHQMVPELVGNRCRRNGQLASMTRATGRDVVHDAEHTAGSLDDLSSEVEDRERIVAKIRRGDAPSRMRLAGDEHGTTRMLSKKPDQPARRRLIHGSAEDEQFGPRIVRLSPDLANRLSCTYRYAIAREGNADISGSPCAHAGDRCSTVGMVAHVNDAERRGHATSKVGTTGERNRRRYVESDRDEHPPG
jgi:hypothetical protein